MGAAAAAAVNIGSASCCFSPCSSFKKQKNQGNFECDYSNGFRSVFEMNSISAFSPNCISCALPTLKLLPSSKAEKKGEKKKKNLSVPRVCLEIDANIQKTRNLSSQMREKDKTKQTWWRVCPTKSISVLTTNAQKWGKNSTFFLIQFCTRQIKPIF